MRILAAGIALIALGLFFTWDSISKSSWGHVEAQVQSVVTTCNMKSTSYGVLTKTTSSAAIACEDVTMFEAINSDKDWTVTRSYLATVLVPGAAGAPLSTTVAVPKEYPRGTVLKVVQDPSMPTRVKLETVVGQGMILALGMIALGALLALWGWSRVSKRRKLMAMLQRAAAEMGTQPTPMPAGAPAYAAQPAYAAAPSPAPRQSYIVQPSHPPRTFGKRK